jgi:hypothetical protein
LMASRAASTCSLALGLGTPAAFAEGVNGHGITDVKILNYALTLERLEYEFYRRMLSRLRVRFKTLSEGWRRKPSAYGFR